MFTSGIQGNDSVPCLHQRVTNMMASIHKWYVILRGVHGASVKREQAFDEVISSILNLIWTLCYVAQAVVDGDEIYDWTYHRQVPGSEHFMCFCQFQDCLRRLALVSKDHCKNYICIFYWLSKTYLLRRRLNFIGTFILAQSS